MSTATYTARAVDFAHKGEAGRAFADRGHGWDNPIRPEKEPTG